MGLKGPMELEDWWWVFFRWLEIGVGCLVFGYFYVMWCGTFEAWLDLPFKFEMGYLYSRFKVPLRWKSL